MRKLIWLCMIFLAFVHADVQAGSIKIQVKIEGLTYDTLWFGKTIGRKPIIEKACQRKPDGSYDIVLNKGFRPGFYAVFFKVEAQGSLNYFHIAMEEGQSDFKVTCSLNDVFGTLRFSGNEESNKYFEYRNTVAAHLENYMKMIDYFRYRPDEQNYKFITDQEEQIAAFQQKFLAKNKRGLTARIATLTKMPSSPKTGDFVKDRQMRWQQFTQQYLKEWQAGDTLFWSTTLGIAWLDHYVLGLWDNEKMDASIPADEALTKLSPYPAFFAYYLEYLLHHFGSTGRFDQDKVYVFLTRKYVEKADKSLLGEEEFYRHTNQANSINRLMTGTFLPDLRFYDEKNYPRHVYDLDANYTLLVFWNPDCPHCLKDLPQLAAIYPAYKNLGLKVITICGKREDKVSMCWEGRDRMALPTAWYYWADPMAMSRFQVIYNIFTLPSMYLLDQNHRIVFRVRGEMMENELSMLFEKHLKKM